MDKYIVISPDGNGTFSERLEDLREKVKNYLSEEEGDNRTLQYCKTFFRDLQNQ